MRRRNRSSVTRVLALAGAATLGYAGIRRLYGLTPGCDADFFNAVITKNYLARSSILPAGEPVADAAFFHAGWTGRDLEFGRLTIRYDDQAEPIDLYARRQA